MSNMSYCRFRNALEDLKDCFNHWDDVSEDNEEELEARQKMLNLCQLIVDIHNNEGGE